MTTDYLSPYYLIPGLLVLASVPLLLRLASSPPPATAAATPSMGKDHTFVVLGAGYIGVAMAHRILKNTPANINLKVVLVAPNDALYWAPATVRGILPSGPGIPDDQLFGPLLPTFAHYGKDRFEFVLGRAHRLDPDASTVDVRLQDASEQPTTITTLRYDSLLIATGADFRDGMPFKVVSNGGTAATKKALADWRQAIAAAQHIVVAGGGETGTELAAELGHAYAKTAAGSHRPQKEIVLVASDSMPMSNYGAKEAVQKETVRQLQRLGVAIVANTRVSGVQPGSGGSKTVLTLTTKTSGGTATAATTTSTLETDLYIPAFGIVSNTQFLPEAMLDTSAHGQRRVRTTTTLQAENYPNIFVAGDATNIESQSLLHISTQLEALALLVPAYLANWLAGGTTVQPLVPHKPSDTVVFTLSLGPGGGTGQYGSWKIWSFVIWLFKARRLGTDYLPDYAAGKRTMQNKKW